MEYLLKNDVLEVIISDRGAELQSVKKDGADYLWYGDKTYWPDRSPLLFPYEGRFTDGRYTVRGKAYGMKIHGFASDMIFSLKESTAESASFYLQADEATLKQYPFDFSITVSYCLEGSRIKISYEVTNPMDEMLYFGIGGHPGFRVPLEEGLTFSDYYLEFGTACRPDRVGHTPACFVSGENKEFPLEEGRKLPLRHDLFDDDAIALQHIADSVTLKSDKGSRSVMVRYPDFPYLGLWHAPKTQAPYLCIEPWASLPSRQDIVEELTAKSDLIRLRPGGIYRNDWEIELK